MSEAKARESPSCRTSPDCQNKMRRWAIIGIVLIAAGTILWIVSSVLTISASVSLWGFTDPATFTGSVLTAYYLNIVGHILFWSGIALAGFALVKKYLL